MPLPRLAQRPFGVAPINASSNQRRGSRNGGPGQGTPSGRSFDGAGVLLFSTHFGREIEGLLFQGGRPTGLIFDRVHMKTYRPSFKAYTDLGDVDLVTAIGVQ